MQKTVTNIFHKLHLEIVVPDMKTAKKVQEKTDSFLKDVVLKRLEALLQELIKSDNTYRTDLLNIELSVPHVDVVGWEEKFIAAFDQAVRKSIDEKEDLDAVDRTTESTGEKGQLVNPNTRTAEALLFFLQHGTLPWWTGEEEFLLREETLVAAIAGEEDFFAQQLSQVLQRYPQAVERLQKQFSLTTLTYFFSLLVPYPLFSTVIAYRKKILQQVVDEKEKSIIRTFWQQVYANWLRLKNASATEWENTLQEITDEIPGPVQDVVGSQQTANRGGPIVDSLLHSDRAGKGRDANTQKEELNSQPKQASAPKEDRPNSS
jgi:hypothetical protein